MIRLCERLEDVAQPQHELHHAVHRDGHGGDEQHVLLEDALAVVLQERRAGL